MEMAKAAASDCWPRQGAEVLGRMWLELASGVLSTGLPETASEARGVAGRLVPGDLGWFSFFRTCNAAPSHSTDIGS